MEPEVDPVAAFAALAHPQRLAVVRLLMRHYPRRVAAGEIGMVLVSHDDTVRVGTKRGVYRLAGDRFEPELAALPADEVSALLEDRHGALWVGTVGHGVFRASGRGVEALGIDQGLLGFFAFSQSIFFTTTKPGALLKIGQKFVDNLFLSGIKFGRSFTFGSSSLGL